MKVEKGPFLITLVLATLVFLPIAVYGQTETGALPPTPVTDQVGIKAPPVEQPLVPEGVFAVQLVEALKLGQAQDEAQAESMLSAVGIEPKNGWIAGYPVTPPIIGEIERGVAAAADAGKLGMGKGEALKAAKNLEGRLGLGITAGMGSPSTGQMVSGSRMANTTIYKYVDKNGVVTYTDQYESIPGEYRDQVKGQGQTFRREVQVQSSTGQPAPEVIEMLRDSYGGNPVSEVASNDYSESPNPEVVNNYYYDNGPPVVTYYPPPSPYDYLYAWVPYPFWCSGFYFPGFFILHDFHRHVYLGRHSFVVSNHVAHGGGHGVFVVDPVSRTLRGGGMSTRNALSPGFRSPGGQSGARTIVGHSQNRAVSRGVSAWPRTNNAGPSNLLNRSTGPIRVNRSFGNGQRVTQPRSTSGPSSQMSAGRSFSPHAVQGRSFSSAAPQVSRRPLISEGRVFSTPASHGRSSWGGFRQSGGISGHGGSFGGSSRGR